MKWLILILVGIFVVTHLKVTTKNTTFSKLERTAIQSQKKITNSIVNVDTLFSNVPKLIK